MSTPSAAVHETPPMGNRLGWAIADTFVTTKRYAITMAGTPEVLFYTAVQPILFLFMFTLVFGGSIVTPGGSYAEYLMPGIFVQTVAFAVAVTSSAVAIDIQRGVIDRFRSLPMSRSAVLVGRAVSDVALDAVSLLVLAACGSLVGWRIHTGLLEALAAFGLLLLFGFAMSWVGVFIGLSVKAPEVASQATMIWVVPLIFLSNLFVVVDNLPGWLQPLAKWSPVSAVITTVRTLFGNPHAGISDSIPGRYPALVSFAFVFATIAIFAPLAVRKYRRMTH